MNHTLTIPWPPAKLSPNARGHWRGKEIHRTSYKTRCFLIAKAVKPPEKFHLMIIFHPPTKTRRDLDNCLASVKYGLDGVALAWGVDDREFRPITIDFGEPVKDGKVVIYATNN